MKIDAHQHFWTFDPNRDRWITAEMETIRRDFLPDQLSAELKAQNIAGCVAVQATESIVETEYLLELAAKFSFIKGVVGWVDLAGKDLGEELERFQHNHHLVGFRKILQTLPPEAMDETNFRRGLQKLAAYDFTYDILIYPNQLPAAIRLVKDFPNQKFVLDHMAKPQIAEKEIQPWKKQIEQLAALPNISCKVSGLVTEADWKSWKQEDFTPYLDTVVEAFGTDRLLYGSDWPVCLVAASYNKVFKLIMSYFEAFSKNEQEAIFGRNAINFYNLTS